MKKVLPVFPQHNENSRTSSIDPRAFGNPDMWYRPGVRWWWPGDGASTQDLIEQIDYLADNGFGAVEIISFSAGFLLKPKGEQHGSIYQALDDYDKASILRYDTPGYYEKLKAVVEHANQRGIIVDLTAGSGYLANDDSVELKDSMSNIALGRQTICVSGSTDTILIDVPKAEISPLYAVQIYSNDVGEWSEPTLHAVIVAKIADQGKPLEINNQVVNLAENKVEKAYEHQTVLDFAHAVVFHAEGISGGKIELSTFDMTLGEYEVIALYGVPSGAIGLNSFVETDKGRARVVDHLSGEAVRNFVDGWLGDPALADVVKNCAIRAMFNDSYEFYTDNFFNKNIYEMAKDTHAIGYDLTRHIPTFYQFFKESFFLQSPTPKIDGLNVAVTFRTPGMPLMASTLSKDELERVEYDYHQLVNFAFQDGMRAFSETLKKHHGMVYRQEAYNPPIDTLKSAKFIDIPETEGLEEYSLKRVTSGAHLYGKNLITSEVYTLGSTPFNTTPQFIKNGYDLMATSGVNNFFYHGLSATYYGTAEQKSNGFFGEEGWRAWPTIGVEMAKTEVLSPYYKTMNEYAARTNYVMQSGIQSSDVALYMPLFGSLSQSAGFFAPAREYESIRVLNTNGYVWDAINDDCIQTELTYRDGALITAAGARYSALVVDRQTLPVATMEALKALADEGAPILFFGALPGRQPGYADGKYTALDEKVAALAKEMTAGRAVHTADSSALAEALARIVTPKISYEPNAHVRFNRRRFSTGGELAYIRNTSSTDANIIRLKIDASFAHCYWLDQSSGRIYRAKRNGEGVSVTLPANGAVILLCEPQDCVIKDEFISENLPLVLETVASAVEKALDHFTLTVTADNVGSYIPGAKISKTYSGDVLGDWTQAGFLDDELKYVSDPGVYAAEFDISELSAYGDKRLILDLGSLHHAATVRVNGSHLGQLFFSPYELDITDAIREGKNKVEIEVQPLKVNRRIGLKKAYQETGSLKYRTYASHVSKTMRGEEPVLVAAGLIGPVVLKTL